MALPNLWRQPQFQAGRCRSSRPRQNHPGSGCDVLLGQLLAGAYNAVLACKPDATGPAVAAAQQLVRSFRLQGGGAHLSVAGFGGGASRSVVVSNPPSALILDVPPPTSRSAQRRLEERVLRRASPSEQSRKPHRGGHGAGSRWAAGYPGSGVTVGWVALDCGGRHRCRGHRGAAP